MDVDSLYEKFKTAGIFDDSTDKLAKIIRRGDTTKFFAQNWQEFTLNAR